MKAQIRPFGEEKRATDLEHVEVNGQWIIEVPGFGLLVVGVVHDKWASMLYQPHTLTEAWREVKVFDDHLEVELLIKGPRLQVYIDDIRD